MSLMRNREECNARLSRFHNGVCTGVQISSIHNAIRISLICVMKRGNWEHESEGVLEALGKHCGR